MLVGGLTFSSGWVSAGFDTSFNGGGDAFVAMISELRIESISAGPEAGIRISWKSSANRLYEVQRTSGLNAGFETVAGQIPATPPENVFVDDSATGDGPYFYRISVRVQ